MYREIPGEAFLQMTQVNLGKGGGVTCTAKRGSRHIEAGEMGIWTAFSIGQLYNLKEESP